MPEKLRERYEEFMNDPDLLALDDEISVIQARQAELLRTIGNDGHPPNEWAQKVKLKVDEIDELLRDTNIDPQAKQKRFETLWKELLDLHQDHETVTCAWKEFSQNMETLRRSVSTEEKRRVDMHYLVSVDSALALAHGIIQELKPCLNLNDPKARERFNLAIRRLESRFDEAADDPRNLRKERQ